MKKYSPISAAKHLCLSLVVVLFASCQSNAPVEDNKNVIIDSVVTIPEDTAVAPLVSDTVTPAVSTVEEKPVKKAEQPVVLIYNFHVTNRCVSCIAIEDATTKTLNTYFSKEMKEGRIKRQILNVDEETNEKIAEKYQAFGSGLFITRSFKGKENTIDMTGDGFKFAKNKEEKFIELLKNNITEYLK